MQKYRIKYVFNACSCKTVQEQTGMMPAYVMKVN